MSLLISAEDWVVAHRGHAFSMVLNCWEFIYKANSSKWSWSLSICSNEKKVWTNTALRAKVYRNDSTTTEPPMRANKLSIFKTRSPSVKILADISCYKVSVLLLWIKTITWASKTIGIFSQCQWFYLLSTISFHQPDSPMRFPVKAWLIKIIGAVAVRPKKLVCL
jgi:hypothetical protein